MELQAKLHRPCARGRCDPSEVCCAVGKARIGQVDMVEAVECLPAELERLTLKDREVLNQCCIEHRSRRAFQQVVALVSEGRLCRYCEGVCIEPGVGRGVA